MNICKPTFLDLKHLLDYNFNLILIKDGNFHLANIRDTTLNHIHSQKLINFTEVIECKSTAHSESNSEDDIKASQLEKVKKGKIKLNIRKEKKKIKKKLSKQIRLKKNEIREIVRDKKCSVIIKRKNNNDLYQESSGSINISPSVKNEVYYEEMDSNNVIFKEYLRRISTEEIDLLKSNYQEISTNIVSNKFKKKFLLNDWLDEKCKCFEIYLKDNKICLVK
jgi:hypothetical protein